MNLKCLLLLLDIGGGMSVDFMFTINEWHQFNVQGHNILPYAAVICKMSAQEIAVGQIWVIGHFDELTKRSDVFDFGLRWFPFILE